MSKVEAVFKASRVVFLNAARK